MTTKTKTKPDQDTTTEAPKPRGFAAMKARGMDISAIASKGGKAAHDAGTAHVFSTDEAKAAGRLGGIAPHARRGAGRKAKPEAAPAPDRADTEIAQDSVGA